MRREARGMQQMCLPCLLPLAPCLLPHLLILVQIPIGDIGIDPFATHFAIGPEGDNLVITFLDWDSDTCRGFPRDLPEVLEDTRRSSTSSGSPRPKVFRPRPSILVQLRDRHRCRACRAEGSFDIPNLNFCRRTLGIIGSPHDARDDQGREDRENGHHDHDLDKGKPRSLRKS